MPMNSKRIQGEPSDVYLLQRDGESSDGSRREPRDAASEGTTAKRSVAARSETSTKSLVDKIKDVYEKEAHIFIKTAKRVTNPCVESPNGESSICIIATHASYDRSVACFGKCIYSRTLVVIMPLFYRIIKCKCHGFIVYCKNCGMSVGQSSVTLYYHIRECYGFCLDRHILYVTNGGVYRSVEISKHNNEPRLFAALHDLLSILPQIIAFRTNYGILDMECVAQLIQNDKICIKKSEVSTNKQDLINGDVYIIFNDSPGYHTVVAKLTEQLPQCIKCGKFYDHFPSHESVIQHLIDCMAGTQNDQFFRAHKI